MRLACNIRLMWRVLRATPAQGAAIDAVLGGLVMVQSTKASKASDAQFDDVERILSLAFDALLNAIDSYRERKRGGAA